MVCQHVLAGLLALVMSVPSVPQQGAGLSFPDVATRLDFDEDFYSQLPPKVAARVRVEVAELQERNAENIGALEALDPNMAEVLRVGLLGVLIDELERKISNVEGQYGRALGFSTSWEPEEWLPVWGGLWVVTLAVCFLGSRRARAGRGTQTLANFYVLGFMLAFAPLFGYEPGMRFTTPPLLANKGEIKQLQDSILMVAKTTREELRTERDRLLAERGEK